MNIKKKGYILELKDTDLTVYLHAPRIEDFEEYLRKLQSIRQVTPTLQAVNGDQPIQMPPNVIEDMKALVCLVTSVKENDKIRPLIMEEAAQLSFFDCFSIIRSIDVIGSGSLENPIKPEAQSLPVEQQS